MIQPSFAFEQHFWSQGYDVVIGLDEVGRGAFAGPLVAAGVMFEPDTVVRNATITDSKLLGPKLREQLASFIHRTASWIAVVTIPIEVINTKGIVAACDDAFAKLLVKARKHFLKKTICSLIDGYPLRTQKHNLFHKGIIKGDQKSYSIAAASIVAKVYRDMLMQQYHADFPQYEFAKNKGYGTQKHRDALKQYGLCHLHRTCFNLSKFL